MSAADTSGPAYPAPAWDDRATGLSKREYYAAEAMKVLLAQAVSNTDPGARGEGIFAAVESSFFVADLMVKEAAK